MLFFRQEVDSLFMDHRIERRFIFESRQQLFHRSRIKQRPRHAVLSCLARLFEEIDIFFRELCLGMPRIVIVNQLRKPQRASHPSGAATDNHDVSGHLGMVDVGDRFAEDQRHGVMVDICRINGRTPRNLLASVWSAVTKSHPRSIASAQHKRS